MTTVKVEVTEQQVTVSNVGIQGPKGDEGPQYFAVWQQDGTPSDNVYTTFDAAWTYLTTLAVGPKRLYVDASTAASARCEITTNAVYDCEAENIEIIALKGNIAASVTAIPNVYITSGSGAKIKNLKARGVRFVNEDAPGAIEMDVPDVYILCDVEIAASGAGSAPAMVLASGFNGGSIYFGGELIRLGDTGGNAAIEYSGGGFVTIGATAVNAQVLDGAIDGTGFIAFVTAIGTNVDFTNQPATLVFEFDTAMSENSQYDNSTSGLTATNVQAAIDELKALIDALP